VGARAAMHTHLDKSHARFNASWRKANPTELSLPLAERTRRQP